MYLSEICYIDKCLCDAFIMQNILKQRDISLSLLSSLALEYAVGKVYKSKEGLGLYGTSVSGTS